MASPDRSSTETGYTLLDFGALRRLEQWGPVRVVRPDPRALDSPAESAVDWDAADAVFEGRLGQGYWRLGRRLPPAWTIVHAGLVFEVALAPSMHTGLFPEQAWHWEWMRASLNVGSPASILNLFAHTGGASVALAAAGHHVTHVDASRPALAWARRNAALNQLSTIRWIEEDARAFVKRERRRGRRYDALLLDPPTFGRSRAGTWQLVRDLDALLGEALALLDPDARFVLINTYDLAARDHVLASQLAEGLTRAGHPLASRPIESGSLDLVGRGERRLPTGAYARVRTAG